jgi:hypothetical protein
MGLNMVKRFAGGHTVVATIATSATARAERLATGAGASSPQSGYALRDPVASRPAIRTESTITAPHRCSPRDVATDGGTTNFNDDIRR